MKPGYVMNWEYHKVASSMGFSIDQTRGDDLLDFPIDKARLRATYYYMSAAAAATIGYGWALDRHTVIYQSALPLNYSNTKFSLAFRRAFGLAVLHWRLHHRRV
jgi:hypothetical protein